MHISVPVDSTMQFIEATEISPLISKGVCKVCYVGQDPNRNNSVITKEVATEMGKKLPGSPVVGYFDKDAQDFLGHEREISTENGLFEIIDITKPYGFVPTDAKVWFLKFSDDGIEHEYLVTDVYIWTGAYPESKRILEKGNNLSMELAKGKDTGIWANDNKTNAKIFIFNEALIEKLCILGLNVEPCFEGALIKSYFSLEEETKFRDTMFSMMKELQDTLNKGGSQEMDINQKVEQEVSTPEVTVEKDASTYNLDEVVEYTELKQQFDELQNKYSLLEQEKNTLDSEINELKEFKKQAERKQKQDMIDSFYMLTDTDKADVIANIDTYSLDEIEAKLSITCVRNKVNFNLEEQKTETKQDEEPKKMFNLEQIADETGNAPAWIKALRNTANKQQF